MYSAYTHMHGCYVHVHMLKRTSHMLSHAHMHKSTRMYTCEHALTPMHISGIYQEVVLRIIINSFRCPRVTTELQCDVLPVCIPTECAVCVPTQIDTNLFNFPNLVRYRSSSCPHRTRFKSSSVYMSPQSYIQTHITSLNPVCVPTESYIYRLYCTIYGYVEVGLNIALWGHTHTRLRLVENGLNLALWGHAHWVEAG